MDQPLAVALVERLTLGVGLPAGSIFCSSIDGVDVPEGDDFIEYIRSQLEATTLVVPLITPAYLDSMFCMWELGAIWSRGIKMVPVRVEQVAPGDLPELLRRTQIKAFGHPALIGIGKAIRAQSSVEINEEAWQRSRERLLADVPQIVRALEPIWRTTLPAKTRQHARLGAAAAQLRAVLSRVRDAGFTLFSAADDEEDNRAFRSVLQDLAREMAKLFEATTGHRVRVTMKQLITLDGDDEGVGAAELGVEDLARSKAVPKIDNQRDRVIDNSDFNSIVVGKADHFWSNDLDELIRQGSYANSHLEPGSRLPYRSTVVWPIRKVHDHPNDRLGFEITLGQDLVGFLCVDSAETGAFSEMEIELGAGLADALYPVLRPYLFDELDWDDDDDPGEGPATASGR